MFFSLPSLKRRDFATSGEGGEFVRLAMQCMELGNPGAWGFEDIAQRTAILDPEPFGFTRDSLLLNMGKS